jgi:hypothetical protein
MAFAPLLLLRSRVASQSPALSRLYPGKRPLRLLPLSAKRLSYRTRCSALFPSPPNTKTRLWQGIPDAPGLHPPLSRWLPTGCRGFERSPKKMGLVLTLSDDLEGSALPSAGRTAKPIECPGHSGVHHRHRRFLPFWLPPFSDCLSGRRVGRRVPDVTSQVVMGSCFFALSPNRCASSFRTAVSGYRPASAGSPDTTSASMASPEEQQPGAGRPGMALLLIRSPRRPFSSSAGLDTGGVPAASAPSARPLLSVSVFHPAPPENAPYGNQPVFFTFRP